MPLEFVTKQEAYTLISEETGYGRRVIDNLPDKLQREGRITIATDFDRRGFRISRADVDLIIKILRGEIE